MSIQSDQLKQRTMQFALDVLRLIDAFPRSISGDLWDASWRNLQHQPPPTIAQHAVRAREPEFIAKLGRGS